MKQRTLFVHRCGFNPADKQAPHSHSLTPNGKNTTEGLRVETKDREGSLSSYGHGEKTNLTVETKPI